MEREEEKMRNEMKEANEIRKDENEVLKYLHSRRMPDEMVGEGCGVNGR